jgi:hypothetical protein
MNNYLKKHKEYLQSLSIGDIVYPCYDGKPSRSTQCKVTNIDDKYIYVEGALWGNRGKTLTFPVDKTTGEFYTNYGEDNPTLMEYLNEYLELELEPMGDLYVLEDIESLYSEGFIYLKRYLYNHD